MARFELEFDTDTDAFEGEGLWAEAARILRKAADQIVDARTEGHILDINGNTVGTWLFRPDA